jgi:hypothetical protein
MQEQPTLPLEDTEQMFNDDQIVRLIVTSNKKRKFTFSNSLKPQISHVSHVSTNVHIDRVETVTEGSLTSVNHSLIGDSEVVL